MVRLGRDQDFGDEVSQLLRERILIPPEPRLERYAGRAPLFAWLRRVARRIALNVLRTRRRRATDPLLPEHWVQRPCEEASEFPRYLRVVNAAAERALERLATRDVDLLRLHYVSGLNIEQLGQLRNVHRATIARWLVDIRLRIRNDIRRDVRAILKLEGSDCDALFELLLADIDEEFSGLLAAATPDGGSRAGEP
jgi:RNA polymerase sigma-70 factor (ECF subfamily)